MASSGEGRTTLVTIPDYRYRPLYPFRDIQGGKPGLELGDRRRRKRPGLRLSAPDKHRRDLVLIDQLKGGIQAK